MKDPKQFLARFKKWKKGTPIEELYDNGRPTYFESVELLASPMAKNWTNIKEEFKPSAKYVGNTYSNGKDGDEDIKHIINKVNSSRANFVSRLKDPNRKFIQDWASDNIATHKLGVGTDEYGNHYIYPEVQEINGKLIDFTRPPYAPWVGQVAAEERGDTVRVPSIKEGVRFTENYKKYYPKGNTFSDGKDDNELPEVVVTPTKNTTTQVNQMRKIIPNNTLRNLFYDYLVEHTDNISSNDALNRFMKIYKWADNPKIKLMNRYSDGSWESTNKYGTSNPDYFMHTISLGDDRTRDEYMNRSDLLAELSHAYQMMSKNTNRLGLKPPFKSIVEQIRSRDDVDKYGRSGYDRIGNIEYNAHSIIEPVMIDYITGNIAEELFHNALIDKINSVLHSTPKSLYPELYDPYSSYARGKDSSIYIKPSKRGTFTAAAKKRGMSVLSFASKVLNNPSNYSKAMRKKALFAKNASKFKH